MACEQSIWSEMISLSTVPVVIISACGLLCLAFYNRFSVITTLLRSLQKERLSEYKELFKIEQKIKDPLFQKESEKFLQFLEEQATGILRRARLLRNGIFCLIIAVFSLVWTSFLIGLSLTFPFLDPCVPIFFVAGLLFLLTGLFFAGMEIKVALNPIQMESDFVQGLVKSQMDKMQVKGDNTSN